MENSMEISQKLRIQLPYDPEIPLLGIYPKKKKMQTTNLKRYTHLNLHSSTIYNSQEMKATQVSINRWTNKEDVVHTHRHNGILLRYKKSEILPLVAMCLDLENIMLSEIEKDKYFMLSLLCGFLKK